MQRPSESLLRETCDKELLKKLFDLKKPFDHSDRSGQ